MIAMSTYWFPMGPLDQSLLFKDLCLRDITDTLLMNDPKKVTLSPVFFAATPQREVIDGLSSERMLTPSLSLTIHEYVFLYGVQNVPVIVQ